MIARVDAKQACVGWLSAICVVAAFWFVGLQYGDWICIVMCDIVMRITISHVTLYTKGTFR